MSEPTGTTARASQSSFAPRHRSARSSRRPVSPVLETAAAWGWRIIVVAIVVLGVVWLLTKVMLAVLPVFAALLFAALLHRPVGYLRDHGWRRSLATWAVIVAALIVLAAVGYFVVMKIVGHSSELADQVNNVLDQLRTELERIPGMGSEPFNELLDKLSTWVQENQGEIAGGVITAGRFAAEAATVLVVTFFLTYFFLAEGDRIFSWTVRLFPRNVQQNLNGAGHRAFHALSGWMIGTTFIALIHAVVIGTALWLVGSQLVVPLAVLVFLGSYIPLIGAVLFGGLAVVVTLLSAGLIPGLIILAVLVFENQLESHVLQPFVVGRAVRLHPVAIILLLTAAGWLGGIVGAIMVIPVAAAIHGGVKFLTGIEDVDGNPLAADDRMEPRAPPLMAVGVSHRRPRP